MKNIYYLIFTIMIFSSCVKEEQFSNSAQGNFDACWKILNEKYCFFAYKDIDWDEIYNKYQPYIKNVTTKDSLFDVLNSMICVLQDRHVNLYAPFNLGRYLPWFPDYPTNYNTAIQDLYIGPDYKIAGGMKYCYLADSIGYIYYGSFSSGPGETNLDYILHYFRDCKGLIFDIRDNGGGALTNVTTIVSRFIDNKILSGYIQHKTGPGHDDFSELYPMHISPSDRIKYYGNIALLTNRSTFSAANNFTSVMRILPQVTTFGDKTGGGSGLPFSSELPIGWSIRFSASPIYDAEKNHTEFGIDPDFKVNMTTESMIAGKDRIIDAAKLYLLNLNNQQ